MIRNSMGEARSLINQHASASENRNELRPDTGMESRPKSPENLDSKGINLSLEKKHSLSIAEFLKSVFWKKKSKTDHASFNFLNSQELQMAAALHVNVSDLEDAVRPLRNLHILYPSTCWPTVHIGPVDSNYLVSSTIIGHGTGGSVRKVKSKFSGKILAMKQFRGPNIHENWKTYVSRLTVEYCLSWTMDHPNIIKTIDLIIDEKTRSCYEVMEFCEMDLLTFINTEKYELPLAFAIFKQVALGLSYLHSRSLAHLDMKPENIGLVRNRVSEDVNDQEKVSKNLNELCPKIIDFGLCTHTRKRGICGSAPYIAPEEFTDQEYNPQKVDIWSLGIILIALIFRGFQWKQATYGDFNYEFYHRLSKMNKTKQFPAFRHLNSELRDVLVVMLDPDPDSRADIEDILKSKWFQSIEI